MTAGTPRFKKGDRVRVKREGSSTTGFDADNLRGQVGTIVEDALFPMKFDPGGEYGWVYEVAGEWAFVGSSWEQQIPEDLLEPADE